MCIPVEFVVFPDASNNETLLGIDFITKAKMVLNFSSMTWYTADRPQVIHPLLTESSREAVQCASVNLLREDEGTSLTHEERSSLEGLLGEYSDKSYTRHPSDLRAVFDRLRLFKLRANRDKCVFAREKVKYLGHVISQEGMSPDEDKVLAVLGMKEPTGLQQLRTFLQTCSWFRKFIPDFAKVSEPLTRLTKGSQPWEWTSEQGKAFETLKKLLSSAPILVQADYVKPFLLRTDASSNALGAALLQGEPLGREHPIECAPGKINVLADTLSRPRTEDCSVAEYDLCPVVVDVPCWSATSTCDAQLVDPEVAKINQDLEGKNELVVTRWSERGCLSNQAVLYRDVPDTDSEEPQLVIPESLRSKVMLECHDSPEPYVEVDLVLLKTHVLSNDAKGVTSKFTPKRDGPYVISKKVSPTTYLLAHGKTGEVFGKYHVSDLRLYHAREGECPEPIMPKRGRGRPRKPLL